MILKNKYFCFLLSVILQVAIASQFYNSNEELVPDIAKMIRNLNSEHKVISNVDDLLKPNVNRLNKKNVRLLLKKYLRNLNTNENSNAVDIEDKMCKKTGKCSCGRSGVLCDAQDIYDVADDVNNIINNINRQANSNNDENFELLRCNAGRCGSNHIFNKLKDSGDSVEEIDDDNALLDIKSNQNLLQAVISEIKDIADANSEENYKLRTNAPVLPLTPEDMANYYRVAMDDVRKTLLGFIKYRTNIKTVRGLPRAVRGGIQSIREKYRHFKMSDKVLSKQIFDLLLGDMKKIKIVPNKDPEVLYDVFLPDWMYLEALKKKQGRSLRTNKRVLPLTLQQKNRMQVKDQPKKLLKYVWRRSEDSDQAGKKSKYGAPFVLNIQGLGQIN